MSTLPVPPPATYAWVLLAATSTFFVNSYHTLLTSKFRKASGCKYPNAYAAVEVAEKDPKAFAFNCAQRAHANFTENHPSLLIALLISGLRYPILAAVIGVTWSACRVLFAAGYVKNGPKGRLRGSYGALACDLALKFTAVYASVMMALEM